MNLAIYKDTLANNRGADVAVRNLAAGLAERGHSVTLFTKSEFAEKVRGDYDVIISTGTNEILDLAKVDGLPPVVQQFHPDPAYPFRHWIKKWRRNRAIKAALEKVAAIQVLREEHRTTLKKLGIAAPGVEVIGNWSSFNGMGGEGAPLSKSKVILCPGAINKDKNQKLLVDAFRTIAADFPDWEVHLYGNGKATFKTHPQVKMMGFGELSQPYADCAFVAFPSKTEGFGLVIADAAAFGKPTLCIKDWIGCGFVVPGTVPAFAAGLRRLMMDVSLRRQMGERARVYCGERYSREKILDQWEALLADIA